jgi:hypothetical protein
MGKNQPTEDHIYTGDEHHDGTNQAAQEARYKIKQL